VPPLVAASAPATNSSESPGRKGVTTSPVSQKTMRKQDDVDPGAVLRQQHGEVLVDVEDDVDELGEKFHGGLGRYGKARFYRKL
jgi:hypothetical protein